MNNEIQRQEECHEVMTFHFSESQFPVRNLLINGEPWFVAKDVCDVLGLASGTNKAIQSLDDDEKLTRKIYVSGQLRNIVLISESGLYALVLRSNKPYAKVFRKWITSSVIPSLRKTGRYIMSKNRADNDFIDARNIPYEYRNLKGYSVRCIMVEDETWISLNDIHKCIGSNTGSNQAAKKLNQKDRMAQKIWIFGNTHPAWFVTSRGVELLLCASPKFNIESELQLELPFRF